MSSMFYHRYQPQYGRDRLLSWRYCETAGSMTTTLRPRSLPDTYFSDCHLKHHPNCVL